ncbi:Hormone-sensitive lipase [Halotydeus destructor]|nr:Hormone-sensitive lipase [Halotydeus destructor]
MDTHVPADLDQVMVKFNDVCSDLKLVADNREVSHLITKIRVEYEILVKMAPEFDVQGLPVNGLRSLLRLWLRVFEVLRDNVHEGQARASLRPMLTLVLNLCQALHLLSPLKGDEVERQKIVKELSLKFVTREVLELCSQPMFIGMLYSSEARTLLTSIIRFAGFFLSKSLVDKVKCAASLEFAVTKFTQLSARKNYRDFVKLFSVMDNYYVRSACRMFYNMSDYVTGFENRVVSVAIGSKFRIIRNVDNVRLARTAKGDLESTVRRLRCNIIRKTPSWNEPDLGEGNKVLLFFRGGAFFGPSADAYSELYIRNIAERVPGLTILAFDYRDIRYGPFPVALQECVDFYLWLTSGQPEVAQTLGFQPSGVSVAGESSGGHLGIILPLVLNDIRHMAPEASIPFPEHLITIFPRASIKLDISPGTLMLPFEPLLNMGLMSAAGAAYAPLVQRENNNGAATDYDGRRRGADWMAEAEIVRHHYLIPGMYDKMADLSGLPLAMMVFDFCPFVDDGLDLAKRWPGPVKLCHLDNTFHAIISFSQMSPEARSVTYKIGDLIRESLEGAT